MGKRSTGNVKEHFDSVSDWTDRTLLNTSPSFVIWLCDRINKVRKSQDKPLKIVDFGGGNVIMSKQLVETYENIDYICYDISERAILECRGAEDMKLKKGSRAEYIESEAIETLSNSQETFDVILFLEVFPYLRYSQIEKLLRAARARLSPNGRIFITGFDAKKLGAKYKDRYDLSGKKIKLRPMNLKKLLERVGKVGFKKQLRHISEIPAIKNCKNFVYHTRFAYQMDFGIISLMMGRVDVLGNFPDLSDEGKAKLNKMGREFALGNKFIDELYTFGELNATEAEAEMRKQLSIMFQEYNQTRLKKEANEYFLLILKK